MKKVIIIGAGPAGLTAGYDLLSKSSDYDVTIIEESPVVGGLCARLENDENVLDAGGHLYISNNPAVKKFWSSVLPAQGVPSKDDLQLDRYCKINNDGPDPEVSDDVLLSREKITRVYKDGKFFESPIKFNKDAVKNFGIANSIKTGFSQIGGNVFKHKELSLEDYYVNRFGKQLYSMFLEEYLEKIWGKEPSKIKAEWGEIAEKSLIAPVISTEKNIRDYEKLPAPYANRYYYPKYGSFQMWETAADRFIEMGGSIHKNCKVTGFTYGADKIISVRCCADGDEFIVPCDYLISSMPIRDLILGMDDVDGSIRLAAENLTYRGLISVCVELSDMKWKNDNKEYKSIDDIVPDSVIYISDPNLKVSRIQVYNNFSPYMIRDSKHFYLGLNYYCNEGDYYWSMGNRDWRKTVVNDLLKLGIIDSEESIIGYNKTKYSKAFPMYYDGYENLEKIINFLNGFENLYCVGRNGQHRFSSVDEAMKTSFEAVNNIIGNVKTKDNVWKVNEKTTEDDKVYNSALLSGEGEYRGNYIPLQKKLDLDNNDEDKEYVPPRRMRRPMMTPIKKADPNKLSEPIIINDSVVIAARPEKSIPISDEDVTDEALLNEQSAIESVTESVQFDDFDTKEEYEVKEVANEYEVNVENTESLNDADLFAMANESIELEENAQIDAIEEDIIPEAVSDTVETAEDTTEQKIELTNDYLDEILGLDFDEGKKKKTSKARGKKAAVKEKNSIDDSPEEKNEDALTESFAKEADKILEEFAVEENTEIIETEEPIVEAVSETLEEAVIEAVPEFVEEAAIEEVPETADEAVIETVPEFVEEAAIEEVSETADEAVIETVTETEEAAIETYPEIAEVSVTEETSETMEDQIKFEIPAKIDAISTKAVRSDKGRNSKKGNRKNFSFNILSDAAEEELKEKEEEKKVEDNISDGFSLPGAGRNVFSRRTRSSLNELVHTIKPKEEISEEINIEETFENTQIIDSSVEAVSEKTEVEEFVNDSNSDTNESTNEETIVESTNEETIVETENEETIVETANEASTTQNGFFGSIFRKADKIVDSADHGDKVLSKPDNTRYSFGRTTSFKLNPDTDSLNGVERKITREQAIGNDKYSTGVSFSKVDTFEKEVIVGSVNPHERVIGKDQNYTEESKVGLKVAKHFSNVDIPEEKRIERQSVWDLDVPKELRPMYPIEEEKNEDDLTLQLTEEYLKTFDKKVFKKAFKSSILDGDNADEEIKEEKILDFSKVKIKGFDDKAKDSSTEEDTKSSLNENTEQSENAITETAVEDSKAKVSSEKVEEVKESIEEMAVESIEENIADSSNDEILDTTEEISEAAEAIDEVTAEEISESEEAEEVTTEDISESAEAVDEVTAEEISESEETAEEVTTEDVSESADAGDEAEAEETEAEASTEEEKVSVEEAETISEEKQAIEDTKTSKEISAEENEISEVKEEKTEAKSEDEEFEELSFETPVRNESRDYVEAKSTKSEASEFEKAAEEMEAENDTLSGINEQAASRAIVKSWQNKYNGVGSSQHNDEKEGDRIVKGGSFSNDLYNDSFAINNIGKKGVLDYELDDLDGGKGYVPKNTPKTIIKSESYLPTEKEEKAKEEKDLSAFKIVKEDSAFGFSSKKNEDAPKEENKESEKEEIKESVKEETKEPVKEETKESVKEETKESVPVKKDSISPSPIKPIGDKRADIKKEIDTSIVFKNARVIKSTKITHNIEEEENKEVKKEKIFSDKQKVIAIIKNGEKIPVNDESVLTVLPKAAENENKAIVTEEKVVETKEAKTQETDEKKAAKEETEKPGKKKKRKTKSK